MRYNGTFFVFVHFLIVIELFFKEKNSKFLQEKTKIWFDSHFLFGLKPGDGLGAGGMFGVRDPLYHLRAVYAVDGRAQFSSRLSAMHGLPKGPGPGAFMLGEKRRHLLQAGLYRVHNYVLLLCSLPSWNCSAYCWRWVRNKFELWTCCLGISTWNSDIMGMHT